MTLSAKKTLVAWLLLGVGAGVFGTTLVRATLLPAAEVEVVPANVVERSPATQSELPSRLRIDALGIDTHVQHVGVKANGQMMNPSNFTDVGWYKYGTVPGYRGSAVFAGHVDNGLSLAGVFKRLGELRAGDEIEVETAGGEVLRFVVREVVSYPYQDVPAQKLFNRDDGTWLNLITCDGAWLKDAKTYDQRLVVYAELMRGS